MKKILSFSLAILMMVSCVILLSSCSSEEDTLLGTWDYKLSSSEYNTYTFKKQNGEYVALVKMKGSYSNSDYTTTYEINGNKILFTLENGKTITETYSLDGNTLTIGNLKYAKK